MSSKVVGVGVDVVDIETLRSARFKRRVAEYFLSEAELLLVPEGEHEVQYLASRFALKEAIIKAIPEKLSPFDFCIQKKGAKPVVVFVDEKKHPYNVQVSVTHSRHTAAGVAVATR